MTELRASLARQILTHHAKRLAYLEAGDEMAAERERGVIAGLTIAIDMIDHRA